MRNLTSKLRLPLRSFGRDEGGTVVAEAVIVLPLFLWAYIALFVYWDSFRSMNTIQKAAFTISDMISREQTGISTAYVNGMSKALEYLIDEDQSAKLRVTSVTWSTDNNRFEVHWSRSPDARLPELTNATLQDQAYQIPTMSPGDFVIVVEVEVGYKPSFDIGMPDQTFKQFIVTRPRFLPCLPLDAISCPVT
jgi:hypothetical protein